MTIDLQSHYDGYYDGASEWRSIGAVQKADNIVQLWGEQPAQSLIDIGCGDGALLARLEQLGWSGVGFEISSSAVAAARSRGLEVERFDGRLPVDDGRYELAVLSHVVEHVEDPRAVLTEARRVAEWVFVEVPLEYHARTPRNHTWTPVGHINPYSMKLMRHLLQSTGLTVKKQRVANCDRATYVFQRGTVKGSAQWVVREAALRLAPPVAPHIFTYHGAFLCHSGAG